MAPGVHHEDRKHIRSDDIWAGKENMLSKVEARGSWIIPQW